MPFLAFPGTAISVSRSVGLYFLKANRADEDPFLRFVDTNSIENIICLLTTLTRFGPYAFDGHFTESFGLGTENVRLRNLAVQRVSSSCHSFSPATIGTKMA
jgi:hypothetical protein